ncbi:hypothetical protein H9623_07240 [Oerskovia sp. Sa1BUA8]|uniref:Uncharacterized protein n=1 Tax=Oerskovia douganii TaxID=2762210 RepID=A0A9D5U8Z0_9CELL|nr:hypothetical protein [Oerskovia douganii]MBE7700100.1 hypothetical protein [Oerskovia douganii]
MTLRTAHASRARRPAWAAPWPDATARATAAAAADRRRARGVTYGIVLALLLTAAVQVEVWPLTAYRLFSAVRTDTSTVLDLVAETADGDVTVLPAHPAEPLTTTASQYRTLTTAPPERRHAMVTAWLDLAGIDTATVSTVRLDRTVRTLEPGTDRWVVRSRETVLEVVP